MLSNETIYEFFCEPCDSRKQMLLSEWGKMKKIQEAKFKDEWKDADICFECFREHQRSLGDYYTEEECLAQEKELRERGFTQETPAGRWISKSGGIVVSFRLMNRMKQRKAEVNK